MRHRIVHTLQKYLLNPPIKIALAVGLPSPGTGRRRSISSANTLAEDGERRRRRDSIVQVFHGFKLRFVLCQTLIHELGHYLGMTEEQLKDV
jgi:hypothetical protein